MRTLQVCLLAGAFLIPVSARSEALPTVKPVPPAPTTAKVKPARAEKHPAIHAAIRSLEKAQAELKAAAHDFGGHKADAIRSVDEAIKQLRLADAYDNK